MAVYFQFSHNGEQITPQQADDLICKNEGVVPDKKVWYGNWYSTIGFGLALGRTYEELRECFPEKTDIIDYIEKAFTVDTGFCR